MVRLSSTGLRGRVEGRRTIEIKPGVTVDYLAVRGPHGLQEWPEHECEPCRRCVDCEGEEHHWMYIGDEDEAGEPVMSCKHCDATRPTTDDDQ